MRAELLANRIIQRIAQAAELYHRLVILVAMSGSGKTAALQDVHKCTVAPLININLELSRKMLDLTEQQRALQLPRLLSEIIDMFPSDVIMLDNIEILFDVSVKQDPLRLLQMISRRKTIVAAWSGSINSEHIMYAMQGHPEFRRYPVRDFLVVSPEAIE